MVDIKALYKLYQQHPQITTDSRDCPEGSIFLALKGESFNGNQFALQALEKGCSYAIVDEDIETSHLSPLTSHFLNGYEIHMGETVPFGDAKESPLLQLSDGRADGYFVDNQCMGTYVHGILDNAPFVDFLLQPFADKLAKTDKSFDYQAFKEEQYDRLAEHVRKHVDMEQIYKILTDD